MTQLKSNEFHQQLPLQYNYIAQQEDISLVDLWISARRYKKRFMLVFSAVFLIGLSLMYFTFSETYSLTSAIQIGTREQNNSIIPIESPESLLSKISSSIIPSYTNVWVQQNNIEDLIEVKPSNPKNSNVILLTSKAGKENIAFLSEFQKGLVQIILEDHKRTINSLKSTVESELRLSQLELSKLNNPLTLKHKMKMASMKLNEEEAKLKKLEDEQYFGIQKAEFQADILQARNKIKQFDDLEKGRLEQFKRIENSKKILLEKIKELKVQISEARENMRAAAAGATELSAMSQLLMANEVQQNEYQLVAFEERYYVELDNEKTDLMLKIEDIRLEKIVSKKELDILKDKYKAMLEDNEILRKQQRLRVDEVKMQLEQIQLEHKAATAIQEERVRELKTRLENFSETRAVSTAIPSLNPVGISRAQLVVLVFVVAGFTGFLAVLFAMFGDKVKERLEEEG
jgi:hypothetical protein